MCTAQEAVRKLPAKELLYALFDKYEQGDLLSLMAQVAAMHPRVRGSSYLSTDLERLAEAQPQ